MRSLTSILGHALLELALVLPPLLLLILGAFDLSRSLHAYGVLQEASSTALRCLYPTDGECLSVSSGGTPLYDVNVNRAPAKWPINMVDYSGEGQWLTKPASLYVGPERSINKITYRVKTSPYTSSAAYGVKAAYSYFLMTELAPIIDNRLSRYHPEMWHRGVGEQDPNGRRYQPWSSTSLAAIKLSTSPGINTSAEACVQFYVPTLSEQLSSTDPERAARPCYELEQEQVVAMSEFGEQVTSSGRTLPRLSVKRARCSKRGVNLVHHITGSGGTSGQDSWVQIELKWREDLGQEWARETGVVSCPDFTDSKGRRWSGMDQGGRRLGAGEGSFVPRGAPYVHNLETGGLIEFSKYSEQELPRGKNVYLHFAIKTASGVADWQGESLDLYLPTYRYQQGTAECPKKLIYSGTATAARRSACGARDNTFKEIELPDDVYSGVEPDCAKRLTAVQDVLCLTKHEAAAQAGQDLCGNRTLISALSDAAACVGSERTVETVCSGTPVVVAETSAADKDCAAVRQLCSAAAEIEGEEVGSCTWTRSREAVGAAAEFKYVREDCSYPVVPGPAQLPPDLSGVENLIWSEVRPLAAEPIYTGNLSPAEYRQAHPEYACEGIGLAKEQYDYVATSTSNDDLRRSLFNGVQSELCDLEVLHQEALGLGLAAGAFFVPKLRFVRTDWVDDKPAADSYRGVPSYEMKSPDGWEKLSHGPFRMEEIPVQCQNGEWRCRLDLAAWQDRSAAGPSAAKELAARRAFAALQAAIPNAKLDCEGAECAQISVRGSTEQGDFEVQSSFRVPLLLKAGRPITLSYTAKHPWEGIYAR